MNVFNVQVFPLEQRACPVDGDNERDAGCTDGHHVQNPGGERRIRHALQTATAATSLQALACNVNAVNVRSIGNNLITSSSEDLSFYSYIPSLAP